MMKRPFQKKALRLALILALLLNKPESWYLRTGGSACYRPEDAIFPKIHAAFWRIPHKKTCFTGKSKKVLKNLKKCLHFPKPCDNI